MSLLILAVSSLKTGPEQELCAMYSQRFPIDIKEIKPQTTPEKEGLLIIAHIRPDDWVCVLDERGQNITSVQLAHHLAQVQCQYKRIVFVIGGAFGIADVVKQRANSTLAFGKMTWPHKLVRPLLMEQLYRCHTLNTNHPYHKA